MLTGSFAPDGHIYFFKGLGNGKYDDAKVLTYTNGSPIAVKEASSVAVSDWDKSGRLSLIVGYKTGPVKYFKNEGNLMFGKEIDLRTKDGETIQAENGGPCIADWDNDGTDDLILGDGEGGVRLFKGSNSTKSQLPALGPAQYLVPPVKVKVKSFLDDAKQTLEEQRCGYRAKPEVTDWNADGKPDLLVGDFFVANLSSKNAEQNKSSQKIKAEMSLLTKDMNNSTDGAEYAKLEGKYDALWNELRSCHSGTFITGFVWVFIRK